MDVYGIMYVDLYEGCQKSSSNWFPEQSAGRLRAVSMAEEAVWNVNSIQTQEYKKPAIRVSFAVIC